MAYRDVILATSNLVSYWELNETSGTTAADSKGSTPLTYAGGYTLGVSAVAGTGVQFNGTSGIASSGSTPVTSVTNAAFECWFKLNDLSQLNQALFNNGAGFTGYGLNYNFGSLTNRIYVTFAGERFIDTSFTLQDTNWHHAVLNIKTSGNVEVYLDGSLIFSGGAGTSAHTPASGVLIGRGETTYWFDGIIDEAALYSANLSGATVLAHYEAGRPTVPYSQWLLADASGTTADDAIGSNDGTYNGGYTLNQSLPPIVPSVSFNGSSGYINVSHNTGLAFGSRSISIEAWVKTTASSGTILSKYFNGSPPNGYILSVSSGNVWTWYGAAWVEGSTAVNDGNWHYIVSTLFGTTVKVYIDGALTQTVTQTPALSGNTQNLTIGRSSSGSDYFNGNIARVGVYNYALSATEIADKYTEALSVDYIVDDLTVTDSYVSENVYTSSITDNLTVNDSLTVYSSNNIDDTLTITDTFDTSKISLTEIEDTLTITDSFTIGRIYDLEILDDLVITDSFTSQNIYTEDITDTLIFQDEISIEGLYNYPTLVTYIKPANAKFILASDTGNIVLPVPEWGDSEGLTDELSIKRTITGGKFRYRKVKVTKSLQYNFRLFRDKTLQLLIFLDNNLSVPMTIIDHNNVTWIGTLTNNPAETVENREHDNAIQLQFEAVRRS